MLASRRKTALILHISTMLVKIRRQSVGCSSSPSRPLRLEPAWLQVGENGKNSEPGSHRANDWAIVGGPRFAGSPRRWYDPCGHLLLKFTDGLLVLKGLA